MQTQKQYFSSPEKLSLKGNIMEMLNFKIWKDERHPNHLLLIWLEYDHNMVC